jgi:hypothetical protein
MEVIAVITSSYYFVCFFLFCLVVKQRENEECLKGGCKLLGVCNVMCGRKLSICSVE